jgi:hypothetical protein
MSGFLEAIEKIHFGEHHGQIGAEFGHSSSLYAVYQVKLSCLQYPAYYIIINDHLNIRCYDILISLYYFRQQKTGASISLSLKSC